MTTPDVDFGLFSKDRDLYNKDQAALRALKHIWDNNGRLPNGEHVSLADSLRIDQIHMKDLGEQPMLTERVIMDLANEAVEPTAVLASLLDTIILNQTDSILTIPMWGAMVAGDVKPGGEYNEQSLELAGYVKASVGKVGVAIKVTEEMIKHSNYDLISKHLRAAGAAVIRRKEEKVANAMTDKGRVLFNNSEDGVKSTTGRNGAGTFNGTLTLDDIAYAHERMVEDGFQPDTLVIHPAAWRIFSTESLRHLFGLQRGVTWNGEQSPAYRASQTTRTASEVTSRFPQDWNIVISPYVPYAQASAVGGSNPFWPITDIMICDSNAIGVILTSTDGIETEEWRDPLREIQKIKLKEQYGIAITNDGQGIGLIKDVAVGRGIDFWEEAIVTVSLDDGLGLDRNFTGVPITGQA